MTLHFEPTRAPDGDPVHPYRGCWEANGRRGIFTIECDSDGGWNVIATIDGPGFLMLQVDCRTLDLAMALCGRADWYGFGDTWVRHGGEGSNDGDSIGSL